MPSDDLMKKYNDCNEQLKAASEMINNAKSFAEAEQAKDTYMMGALAMIMIQNHIILELLEVGNSK